VAIVAMVRLRILFHHRLGELPLSGADSLRLLVVVRPNRFSIGQAVDFAWSTYRRRWLLLTGVLVVTLGAWVVLEIVVVTTQHLGILVWALAHLAFLLCFAGIEVGLLRISLALHDGRTPTLADVFKHFNLGPGLLTGQLLYLTLVLSGLVLLVVPGVLLATRFSLIGFHLAAGEGSVLRSFKKSADLTRGATGRLAATLVILFVVNLFGAALLGIGLFVTVPFSVLTMAAIYRQLSATASMVDG
jgi:hypothetical protein